STRSSPRAASRSWTTTAAFRPAALRSTSTARGHGSRTRSSRSTGPASTGGAAERGGGLAAPTSSGVLAGARVPGQACPELADLRVEVRAVELELLLPR